MRSDDLNTVRVVDRPTAIGLLGISWRTLERLEASGNGPPRIQISPGRIGYRVSDLEKWLDARRVGVAS